MAIDRSSNNASRYEEVFDILNCGPRQRFVVKGSDGPVIVHNCVQASCAIMLRKIVDTFKDCCIFHVHDEAILEVPIDQAEAMKARLQQEMERALSWCADLPLVAEPKVMPRYGK